MGRKKGWGEMIQLCENWYLDADANEFKLINWSGETRVDKKGYTSRANDTTYHYSDLSSAMKGLFVHLVRQGIKHCDTLEHLKGVIEQTYDLVNELCKNITPDMVARE